MNSKIHVVLQQHRSIFFLGVSFSRETSSTPTVTEDSDRSASTQGQGQGQAGTQPLTTTSETPATSHPVHDVTPAVRVRGHAAQDSTGERTRGQSRSSTSHSSSTSGRGGKSQTSSARYDHQGRYRAGGHARSRSQRIESDMLEMTFIISSSVLILRYIKTY